MGRDETFNVIVLYERPYGRYRMRTMHMMVFRRHLSMATEGHAFVYMRYYSIWSNHVKFEMQLTTWLQSSSQARMYHQ
jgi:hypothetical protein